MPTKEEYEKLFNEIFGTDIRWSKLSKEELAQLAAVLANPDALIKRLEKLANREPIDRLVDAFFDVVRSRRGPLMRLLGALAGGEEELET